MIQIAINLAAIFVPPERFRLCIWYMHHVTRVPESIALFLCHPPHPFFSPSNPGLFIPLISGPLLLRLRSRSSVLKRNRDRSLPFSIPRSRRSRRVERLHAGCGNSQQFCNDAMHASWEADNDIWRRSDGERFLETEEWKNGSRERRERVGSPNLIVLFLLELEIKSQYVRFLSLHNIFSLLTFASETS